MVHDAVDKFKKMFNSLVESHVLSALHQQHVDFFIGSQQGESFWSANGCEGENGVVEGLNIDFVPCVWLLELSVACSWDFNSCPIAAIVVFEPMTSIAEFGEVFHHIGHIIRFAGI